jgi:hypothetical protein
VFLVRHGKRYQNIIVFRSPTLAKQSLSNPDTGVL